MSTPPQGSGGDNSPKRVPLVTGLQNRGEAANIDARLVNCYAEKSDQGNDFNIYKRPGLIPYSQPSGGAATGRGVFNWNGVIYSVFNGTLYSGNTALGSVANTGIYTFSSLLGATPSIFFQNAQGNYYFYNTTVGLQTVVPGSFSSSVWGQAYLDGTTYVMDGECNIWGSGLNNVATGQWAADNLIVAQSEPCPAVALSKQLVYVVAFKTYSIEMFYDAGKTTGSPLGAVPGQKLNYGLRHFGTLAELSGMLLWVDQIRTGGMSVRIMDQLTAQPCSTPQVERLLQLADAQGYFEHGNIYSWTAKIDGHMFYALTIQNLNVTLVYDLNQRLWYQWTSPVTGGYMPIAASSFLQGATILQGQTDGRLYTLSTTVATDNGQIVTSDIYTPTFDGGTYRRKLVDKMRVIGDKYPGNVLSIRVSDDDYTTWSNFRTIDMARNDPTLGNCGTFVRRAWNIRQSNNIGGRIVSALELDIEVGDL